MLAEPKIICIIPCYNAENTIAEAIESVVNQNYTNWELIIVDDASTDRSVSIIEKYLKDSRITLLQNNTNQGCYYSRNRALYHIKDKKWDWFTIHDADDTSHPDRFSIHMAYAYHGTYNYIYSCGNGNRFNFIEQKLEYKKSNMFVGQAWISSDLFSILGYFDPTTRFSGDSEYEHRHLVLVVTVLQDTLESHFVEDAIEYCVSNKNIIGKLDLKYSYLYTLGYTPNKNLTQTISSEDRAKYRMDYEKKWKQGVRFEDFYINFTPNKEDL